ncbi:phage portal protein [Sphingomonas sp. R1]|uniref:phage portal protein n=1 Tax=Sphingomonas sp. R1 TaxID=399176 RepID=UPI0022253238|nr:phage portal protein [Sphingomonas sp. R1]UYY77786.1 phage portal protein [Sphingomonas sp. R1]
MAGLFGSIAGALERKSGTFTLDQLPGFLMGPESKAGVSVTYSTALQVAAVLACVRVVAQGIAQSPAKLMKTRPAGGADVAREHPLYWLLYRQPFGRQTAFEFWETIVAHLMLCGNAFVFINRVGSGRIVELVLLEPGKVRVTRQSDLTLRYTVTGDDGAGERTIPAEGMWHIRGLSWSGWMGMEVVRLAREAIGLAIALEQSHAEMHKNGVSPSGVYSIEGSLSVEQHAQLTTWLKQHASASGTPLVLDRGAKWLQQQMSGVDAQHVETRRLQIEEVCRALGVMPIMVGLSEKTATYASAEQMFLAHVVHTLSPLANRLEQSADVSLLSEQEQRDGYYLKFNLAALMRGDYKSRQEGLQIMRRNGVINADQWREMEDMNPRDDAGGGQYIVEGNMAVQDGRDLTPVKTTGA